MPSFSKYDVILVRYPFSDLTASKVRPAIVVNQPHVSEDSLIVPLTSRTNTLLAGEFVLTDWVLHDHKFIGINRREDYHRRHGHPSFSSRRHGG